MQIEPTHSYPAAFKEEEGGGIYVRFPDLDNLTIANTGTCGDDMAEAYFMAQDYLCNFLYEELLHNKPLPKPTPEEKIDLKENERVLQVVVNLYMWARDYMAEINGGGFWDEE